MLLDRLGSKNIAIYPSVVEWDSLKYKRIVDPALWLKGNMQFSKYTDQIKSAQYNIDLNDTFERDFVLEHVTSFVHGEVDIYK